MLFSLLGDLSLFGVLFLVGAWLVCVLFGLGVLWSVRRSAVDGEVGDVSLYRDSSAAPVLDLRRNLKAILDLLDSTVRLGASLARDVQLVHLWDSVVRLGSIGSVSYLWSWGVS